MADYGSIPGVQALTSYATFGAPNAATEAQVTAWLAQRCATLNGWLAAAGYIVPVVEERTKLALDAYANNGAACDVERAQRVSGMEDGENRRADQFCKAFSAAEAWITSGAPGGLGAALTPANDTGTIYTSVPVTYGASYTADEYSRL